MNKIQLLSLNSIFFISGFSALIYQIAWQRILFTAFGVDLESITIIISVFMAGLGIGAYYGGRIADKYPRKIILLFAIAELSIGTFGFSSPFLIALNQEWFLHSNTLIIALSNFILLLTPTFFMGCTLPLLTQYLNKFIDNVGNNIGWLYFSNTLGAATSCILTGFLLFRYLTINEVIYLAATLNILIALIILFKYRGHNENN